MKPDALRRYDLNLLVTLHVLLDECSVSRAAERLHLSQSAISRSLGRLRDIFGDELFIRRPHGLQPTSRAIELQAELADALGQVSQVVSPPEFNPALCSQHFTVSLMEHLSMQLVPRLLKRLKQEAPLIRLSVHPWSSHSLSDMTTGRLDMCVNILPLTRSDLHGRTIGAVAAEVLMSKNHPLANSQNITKAQYLAYPHVSLKIVEYTEKPFAGKIAMLLNNRDILLSTSDPHLAFEVVSNTQALMIGTTSLGMAVLDRYNLAAVSVPPELAGLYSNYQLTWHRLRHSDQAQAWLRNLLFEECQSLQQEEDSMCVA